MPARVPLDVDLEDRLLYGLTPMRLAYAVGALLTGFAIWSTPWGPSALRAVAASVVIGIGATVSWGRWRGTPADVWTVDLVLFAVRNHRVIWTAPRPGMRRPIPTSNPVPAPALAKETVTTAA
jgi:hypothetical protein